MHLHDICSRVFGSFCSRYITCHASRDVMFSRRCVSRVTNFVWGTAIFNALRICYIYARMKLEASPPRWPHRRRGCRSCRFRRQRTKFYKRLACHETRTSASMCLAPSLDVPLVHSRLIANILSLLFNVHAKFFSFLLILVLDFKMYYVT